MKFKSSSSYKISALFLAKDHHNNEVEFKADLPVRFKTKKETLEFLESCKNAEFKISDLSTKPSKRSPAPPFTTSTLQQEASRKFGFSVSQTMNIEQKLYEAGIITYMRTDSVNLSQSAINSAKNEISKMFGDKYSKPRNFKTKTKGAQEAHEAIRPTFMNNHQISGNATEKKLYELIWKRTLASQMSEALIEKTTATINISTNDKHFVATGEMIKFDGFLKVYIESTDEEKEEGPKGILPPLKINDLLKVRSISATERFTNHSPRYTEASLVKKLEELGIGRPSTYAPTISTIQQRNYVLKEDRPGTPRDYNYIILEKNKINTEKHTEISGKEKSKMFPTDIGMVVNDFLISHFNNIMDFNFTARVEKQFDEIAEGKMDWTKMIDEFYKSFHQKVEKTYKQKGKASGARELGIDPKSGKKVYVKIGRYGPIAQIGETSEEEKPKFAALRKGQHIETISLEEALDLFKLPRKLGNFENKEVVVSIGRFGPYIRHDSKFYSLKKEDDPYKIELPRAIEIIQTKREEQKKKTIKEFKKDPDLKILNGRWGPYITYKKKNYRIPKKQNPEELNYEDCMKLIEKNAETKSKTKTRSTKSKSSKNKTQSSNKNKKNK